MKRKILNVFIVLAFHFTVAAQAEEFPVPGGAVGEYWGISLTSIWPEASGFTLVSGPSWGTISSEGNLEGVVESPGEGRWEIEVGDDRETVTVVAYFWGRDRYSHRAP